MDQPVTIVEAVLAFLLAIGGIWGLGVIIYVVSGYVRGMPKS